MAIVTYQNLVSESRNNVVSLLNNKSNVADPVTTSSQYRKWIYSRYPDVKSSSFSGYPFIVVRSTDITIPENNRTADGRSGMVTFDIDIEIYTSDRGYGNSDGQGLAHMDAISDDVIQTLMNITNRKILKSYGLVSASIEPTNTTEQALKDEITYKKIIPISFSNRMKVSA